MKHIIMCVVFANAIVLNTPYRPPPAVMDHDHFKIRHSIKWWWGGEIREVLWNLEALDIILIILGEGYQYVTRGEMSPTPPPC